MDLKNLRLAHPRLIYEGYDLVKEGNDLLLTFQFLLEPDVHFQPKLKFQNLNARVLEQIDNKATLDPQLDKLFFHLGLAEIPSYFKAACPPKIVIRHQGQINAQAKDFWHDLLINGLGEFYYQNQIDFTAPDFIQIELEETKIANNLQSKKFQPIKSSPILVPVGGGKDSSTVLGILEEKKLPYDVFLLAPHSPAAKKIALFLQKEGLCQKIIEVERVIDPLLLTLNHQGYLNGHTPFSAYLAFASSTVAYLYGQENILLGNEASSEEENLLYLGRKINHQYSKSLDFEQKFAKYSRESLFASENPPKYLSLLRSLSELEITKKLCDFSQADQRFAKILTTFKSCNIGQKDDSWCHSCPKCAFVFTMLSAYLDQEFISNKIFHENLFNKESLQQTFLDLAGFGDKKPFECVGTFEEVRKALLLAYGKSKNPAPFLQAMKKRIKKFELMEKLTNRSILILGMGREGLSTLNFLQSHFPDKKFAIADKNEVKIENSQNVTTHFGETYLDQLKNYQIIIKTAGIPLSTPEIQSAIAKGSEVLSNTQIFFTLCEGKIIGITGTKGKSTTSKLIYEILRSTHQNTVLLGNIGEAPLNQLDKINQETLVVDELSCHQLAELEESPSVSVVLEIRSEHLDYYKDFEEYFAAKTAIAGFQKEQDYLVFDEDLPSSQRMAALSPAKKIICSLKENSKATVYKKEQEIFYQNEAIIKTKEIPLLGEHNLYNVMPAIAVAKLFDVPNDQIRETIKNFKGLAHRLELVAEIDQVKYFDDSIAVNPHAAIMAIKSFPKGSVILLAGGYERDQDFSELAQVIIDYQVKSLIVMPTTGQRLLDFTLQKGQLNHYLAATLAEATELAKKQARPGDVVLLSPASASFNDFANYEERGKAFKEIVLRNVK